MTNKEISQEDLAKMMAELKELKKEQEAFKKVKDQNDQLSKKVKDLEEKQQEEAARVASTARVNTTTTSIKIPVLKKGMTFKDYEREVNLWKGVTQVAEDKMAIVLINELPEKDCYGGLKRHVIDHIGQNNLIGVGNLKLMLDKMREFLEEHKFIRGVNWLHRFRTSKQKENETLETFFSSLDLMFKEAEDDFSCKIDDFMQACTLVTQCTKIDRAGLGNIMQNIDVDNVQEGKTLYEGVKELMRRHMRAQTALPPDAGYSGVHFAAKDWRGEIIRQSLGDSDSEDSIQDVHFTKKNKDLRKRKTTAAVGRSPERKKQSRPNIKQVNFRETEQGCFECGDKSHVAKECPIRVAKRESQKKSILKAGRVWNNHTEPPSFTHPDGNVYSYDNPVHQKREATYGAKFTATGQDLRQKLRENEAEKRRLYRLSAERSPIVGTACDGQNITLGVNKTDVLFSGEEEECETYGSFLGGLVNIEVDINTINLAVSTAGHAIMDTGCQKTCANIDWIKNYIENLPLSFRKLVKTRKSTNRFKFGNPEVYESQKYFLLPVKFGKFIKLLGVDGLKADIPLLISRENIKTLGITLSYPKTDEKNYMQIEGDSKSYVMDNISGHDWVNVMPQANDWNDDAVIEDRILKMKEVPSEFNLEILATEADDDEKQVSLQRDKLDKLHQQMGHPPMRRMQDLLKTGGFWSKNSQDMLEAIYSQCGSTDCRARHHTQRTKKVAWRDARKLGELVAADLKIMEGREQNILYLVDIATSFVVSVLIDNKSAGHISEKIFQAWYGTGLPAIKTLLTDNGKEFVGAAMVDFMAQLNIKHKCSVPRTPQQNGSVERIHSLVDANVRRLRQDDDQLGLREALIWATWAYNNAELVTGYTPSQLVFGVQEGVTRLLDMAPVQMQEAEDIPMSLAAQMLARETAIATHLQLKASGKIKEMLRRKLVPSRAHKKIGQWVYFKRALETRWSGPAQICHGLGNTVNVKMGGKFYTCRQDDLVPLTETELEKYGLVENSDKENEWIPSDEQQPAEEQVNTEVIIHHDNPVNQDEDVGENADRNVGPEARDEDSHESEYLDPRPGPSRQVLQPVGTDNREADVTPTPPVRRTKAKRIVLPPPKFKAGHRIDFLDRDNIWKKATVISRSGKLSARQPQELGEWYNIKVDNGQKKRIKLGDEVEGWIDVERLESLEDQPEDQQPRQALMVQDSDVHEVKVSQIPVHLHDTEEVKVAKQKQMDKINKFGTFKDVKLSNLNENQKKLIIPSTWALVYKHVNGERVAKARLCARGDREPSSSGSQLRTDCPTASKQALRTLLTVAATNNWKINSIDFAAAFLQGENIDRELYITPPKDIRREQPDLIWRVVKRIYGLKDASRGWYLELDKALKGLGCKVSLVDNSFYTWSDSKDRVLGILAVHIDDILFAGSAVFHREVIGKIKSRYVIGSEEEEHFTFTGWDLKQCKDFIELTQTSFTERIDLNKYKPLLAAGPANDLVMPELFQKLYRSMIGTIGWCTQVSRPDKAAHATLLSMKLGKASYADAKAAYRVIKNMKESPQTIRFSNLGNLQDIKIVSWSDSSYGKFIPGQTINGIVTFAQGKNGLANILDWTSHKLAVPVTSPLAGEAEAALESYSRIKWMRSLIAEVTGKLDTPATMMIDSKSLKDAVGNSNAVKDKRSLVSISTLRAIPDCDNIQVLWTPGKDNLGDHLTKTSTNSEILRETLATSKFPVSSLGLAN